MSNTQIKKTNRVPDYTGKREHAKDLAKRLQDYYHTKGFIQVRVWIEPEQLSSGRKIYGIRSNLVFDVRSLPSPN